jgi:hypothetical protein
MCITTNMKRKVIYESFVPAALKAKRVEYVKKPWGAYSIEDLFELNGLRTPKDDAKEKSSRKFSLFAQLKP